LGVVRPTIDDLRRFAVSRSLFPPVTLRRALDRLGFVQADPIRAPARAQDLTLRHRVKGYRVGDLERRYAALGIEEDFFVNYGFVSPRVHALMHPRARLPPWSRTRHARARLVMEFVRSRGEVHPREVDDRFAHGRVINYWGGSSNATTHLLDDMHYRGVLRVARRERGIRIYAAREAARLPVDESPPVRLDALVDVIVQNYAPLPARTLASLVSRLRYAVPQWRDGLKAALVRARDRLAHARVDGIDWYWPPREDPRAALEHDVVRLLAPFDPVVWDRQRFETFWGWPYRFEAYTPMARRRFGYYALPLLWRARVIGWATLSVDNGTLHSDVGYAAGMPRDRAYRRELAAELDRMREFLGL
jgi:hypothetical protein